MKAPRESAARPATTGKAVEARLKPTLSPTLPNPCRFATARDSLHPSTRMLPKSEMALALTERMTPSTPSAESFWVS